MRQLVSFLKFVLCLLVVSASVYWLSPNTWWLDEIKRLGQENMALRVERERQSSAMFKQGIWYYRTTFLHQTLPQE
jgi:hypothetical protein